MVVFGVNRLFSGKSGCTRAKVVVFEKVIVFRAKMVLFGKVVVFQQKWLYYVKIGYIRAK